MHTYQFDNYYDNDYLYEHTRITNSICVSTEWVNTNIIDKCVVSCDRVNQKNPGLEAVIGLNGSCWARRWKDYEREHSITLDPWDRTTIYDVGNYSGKYDGLTVFEAELQYFQDRLEVVMGYISDANDKYGTNVRVGAFLLDTELWNPSSLLNINNKVYLEGVAGCFDAMTTRLVSTLEGDPYVGSYEMDGLDIIWYLKGLAWRTYNYPTQPILFRDKVFFSGLELPSLASTSIYYTNYDGVFDAHIEAMNEYVSNPSINTHVYENKIVPWFSLCAGYEIPPTVPRRKFNRYIDYPTVYSYQLGRKMNKNNGELSRYIYATAQYPAPFDYHYDEHSDFSDPSSLAPTWIDHFIAYAKGVNDADNN